MAPKKSLPASEARQPSGRQTKTPARADESESGDDNTKKTKKKREPNISWEKNPKWTDLLVAFLLDNPGFRIRLFSDSTVEAKSAGRAKLVAKDGKAQQYGVLAKHVFENDTVEGARYAEKPSRFATSVETRLRRSVKTVFRQQHKNSQRHDRLKSVYQGHLITLGSTGAGIDPAKITVGSNLANIFGMHTSLVSSNPD